MHELADQQTLDEALEQELVYNDDSNYYKKEVRPRANAVNYKRTKRTSTLFEDARGTNRVHKIYLLIIRCMTAFALLCMALSLLIKENEIDLIINKGSRLM